MPVADTVEVSGLKVAGALHAFMENEALPSTGVEPARFWSALAAIVRDLAPANAALLRKRVPRSASPTPSSTSIEPATAKSPWRGS